MSKLIDLTGKHFGKWKVLKRLPDKKRSRYWKCECECGVVKSVAGTSLASGKSTSCGCNRKNCLSHGDTGQPIYMCWSAVKRRCNNPNCPEYKWYGGRGITYQESWNQYENFKKWALNNGYKQGLTLDRKDNSGNYTENNCRWITPEEQSQNRRSTILNPEKVRYLRTTWDKVKNQITQKEFAEQEGISPQVLNNCLKRRTWKNIL